MCCFSDNPADKFIEKIAQESYALISSLGFQKGDNRVIRAGISRAVEIVDEISDDALLGLTVFHSVSYFLPESGDIQQGLTALNVFFGKEFVKKNGVDELRKVAKIPFRTTSQILSF